MTELAPPLEIHDLTVSYDRKPVLYGVDVVIEPGSLVGVVGPNGAGKSTLIKTIMGIVSPNGGWVKIFGQPYKKAVTRVGYVPQRETLDPVYPLTVEEVVAMGGYGQLPGLKRFANPERALARECLERVQLLGRRGALFSNLSGGQRQRALIARALMARPNLLVLDEPTSGVDQQTQELVLDLLRGLNAKEDLGIVLVSHQAAMTRAVRDVMWIADGTARSRAPGEVPDSDALEVFHARSDSEVD